MTVSDQPFSVFATSTTRAGDLHHRFLIHPSKKAMVVIPITLCEHGQGKNQGRFFTDQLIQYLIQEELSCLITEIITPKEDADHRFRMDKELHAQRLIFALTQSEQQCRIPRQPTGLAGLGVRGVCCLLAAQRYPHRIQAVAGVDIPCRDRAQYSERLHIPLHFETTDVHYTQESTGYSAHQDCAKRLAHWFKTNLETKTPTSKPARPNAQSVHHEKTV